MAKLVFAQHKGGRIVHVADVPSGLACNCKCLDCGQPLVARKGEIREHHFGHTSGKEHDWAWETHLHAYAKQLIVEAGAISVPLHEEVIKHLNLVTRKMTEAVLRAGAAPIESEVAIGAVRPDLLLRLREREMPIALEIYVTHACDRAKVAEYSRMHLAVLEIDLSRFPRYAFDTERMKTAILQEIRNKAWLWPLSPRAAVRPTESWRPPAPRIPQAPPEREGPAPALPSPAALQFAVPAWRSVITVRIQPVGEGVHVVVEDMPMALPDTAAQHAAPRIAKLVEGVIGGCSPDAQRQTSGKWFVPAWSAPRVAQLLRQEAARYAATDAQNRTSQVQALSAELRWTPREPLPATADPLRSSYARGRG